MMGHALRHSARIYKDQSGAMRSNQIPEPAINFLPNFVRHHRVKRRLRDFDRQVQFPPMTDVDDGAIRIAGLIHRVSTDQETRNFLDRFLRRRQTDSLERVLR